MGRTVRKWSGWALLILCGPFFKISFLTQAAMFLCILPIINLFDSIQNIQVTFQIVQSLRRVQLFVIPWTVASQAFLANFLKVNKSGIFRESTESCNHCHNPVLGYLHHLRKFLPAPFQSLPLIWVDSYHPILALPVLDFLIKWDFTVCTLWCFPIAMNKSSRCSTTKPTFRILAFFIWGPLTGV